MKQTLIILLGCFYSAMLIAQDNFTLTLELVKPYGKIDSYSYFQARLRNNNDSLAYFIDWQGNGHSTGFRHSFLRGILYQNGKEEIGNEQPFFEYGEKHSILIKPKEEIVVRLGTFNMAAWISSIGLLPPFEDQLRKYQKIRIKLEKFQYLPLFLGSLDPKYHYPKETIDLYSNWVEFDPEDFIRLLKD